MKPRGIEGEIDKKESEGWREIWNEDGEMEERGKEAKRDERRKKCLRHNDTAIGSRTSMCLWEDADRHIIQDRAPDFLLSVSNIDAFNISSEENGMKGEGRVDQFRGLRIIKWCFVIDPYSPIYPLLHSA